MNATPILSIVFNNYKNLNNEQNNNNNQNIKRVKILNDLNVNNNDIFSKKVLDKLEELKNKTIRRFESSINNFKLCYEKFKTKISNYVTQKEVKISKMNFQNQNDDTLLKYVVHNVFNNINDTNEICENIINNIEENFLFLNEYLEKAELINVCNAKEYFLNNHYQDIQNCSILNQFDFKEIDISSISKISYYNNYLNFLNENKKDGLIKKYTIKEEEINKGLQFIKDNFGVLQNLYIHGINPGNFESIINDILKYHNKINGHILKKIKIVDFDLSKPINEDTLNKIRLNKLQKIKISTGKYLHPLIYTELLLKRTDCLTSLSLEKVHMTNYGLNKLLNNFKDNQSLFDTLEYLSLAGNCISAVKKDIFASEEMQDKEFKKLKVLNLYKNNIYKFEISLERMPNLKQLDLSNNSLLTGAIMDSLMKFKNKLVLFNDNIFITNNYNNNIKYIEYLNRQLPNLDFGLKVLHLGFTYYKDIQDLLNNLRLSPSIKLSLIKLDLSFCGLTTDVLINFLKNNYGLFSLTNLNLKYNNLLSDIFKKINCDEINLESLKSINLSDNIIECTTFEEDEYLVKFIIKCKNLKLMKMMNSKYFENWCIFISSDYDSDLKLYNLYNSLVKSLEEDNRRFNFVIDENEGNSSMYIQKELADLFSFRSI